MKDCTDCQTYQTWYLGTSNWSRNKQPEQVCVYSEESSFPQYCEQSRCTKTYLHLLTGEEYVEAFR